MNSFLTYSSVLLGGIVSGLFLFNSSYCKTLSLNDKISFTIISSGMAFMIVYLVRKRMLKDKK